jgi:copper(I)-binding protein
MKLKMFLVCSLMLTLLLGSSLTLAQDTAACNVVTLFDGWTAATPEGAPNGAVYGLLANLTTQPDTLLSASTDAAETVELHETTVGENDVMQMNPVEGGLTIPARDYRELKSGGFHLMLINLKQPLVAGETLDLTLNFEHAGAVSVTVPIKEIDQSTGDTGAGMAMGSGDTAGSMAMSTQPAMPAATMEWSEACMKMHVLGLWARPAVAGMPNSAAYGLLVNLTGAEDTLMSVSTTAAQVAELHEMVMADGDVMQMRPIEGGIVIPSGGVALLKPGGKHMMLIGLTQALDPNTTIDLKLTFAQSGEIALTVPVHEPVDSATPMPGTSMGSGG